MPFGAVAKHPSDECWVVGGGPSCKNFDFERLHGQHIIAINDVMLALSWASAVVSVDRWWMRHRAKQIAEFAGTRYLVIPVDIDSDVYDIPATFLEMGHEPRLSDDPRNIHVRGSSGYAALGVAYLTGAKRINLLGFDYKNRDEHWFQTAKIPWLTGASDRMYADWAEAFDSCILQLDAAGVDVINWNLDSRIECFTKRSLDSLYVN